MDVSIISWVAPTTLGVGLLFVGSLSSFLWQKKVFIGEFACALFLVGGLFLVAAPLALSSKFLLLTVQAWFLLLACRLFFGRLGSGFLRTSTKSNTGVGFLIIFVIALLWWALSPLGLWLAYRWIANGLGVITLLFALILFGQTVWTLKHYRAKRSQKVTHNNLPTITLAIPARNETHALTECLLAAVASDYPKLEILVLDDCSQDKTSALIRSFAHDGVRFIQGKVPAKGWLGKNQAFETLALQATGEYILFAGVDTQLGPKSISQLVDYALSHNLSMVSVLPQRRDSLSVATLLWQLRYFWQIALPITKRRLPVASQAWLIKSDVLHRLGGFSAIKHKILPESFFARRLFNIDSYRFIISDKGIDITTAKKWSSQTESAIRFLYPTFKRQPLFIFFGVVGVGLFLLQFVLLFVLPLFYNADSLWYVAAACCVFLLASYGLVVIRTVPKVWLGALLFLPIALAQELVLLATSMVLYEFGEVNWKGRNICYPVVNYSSESNRTNRDF